MTLALVLTRFGWTPLAPGIFPMMMSCTGLSIHKTLVLPMKYGVSDSTTITRFSTQTAGLAFGGTGLCSYRFRGVGGSRAEHLTV